MKSTHDSHVRGEQLLFNLNKEQRMVYNVKSKKTYFNSYHFPMCLTSIYGYAGDATHYGMKNSIVAQPPVVGAVLKSLGDNQFCISSTIGNPDLVPFIFTEPDESHEEDITDIINAFSSMGVTLCTTAETEKIIQKEVQYVNTSLVDSEVYSNQKRITLVDRISGVVNNDIKIKTGGLMTAWPFELFHFQVPSFTSTIDEEMAVSMETAIETVQGVYTRVFSNSNEGVSISVSSDWMERES